MSIADKPFGKVRNFLWPIHQHEHKKLLPMFCLFFLIAFVYNLLRNMKIALIVTLKDAGPEAIPYLKIGLVLPGALLITYVFTKLISRFSREQVFYTMLIGFISYFAIFTFLLFPYRDSLQLTAFTDYLRQYVLIADGFSGLLAIIKYWNVSLFYVISELWSTVVLSMLFWGFANEVTKVHEAKRFYAVFTLGANSASIFIGIFVGWLSSLSLAYIPFYELDYQWMFYQLVAALVMGVAIVLLFYYLNNSILNIGNATTLEIPKKNTSKLSLRECFSYLINSRYLLYIVIIIISYNIVYNLTDVMWSYRAKLAYSDSKDFNNYISQVTLATGVVAALFGFFLSGNIIRRYGWTIAALVTPVVWLATSSVFYSSLFFESYLYADMFNIFIGNPANLILVLGTIQICLGRGCKYTIFDATKEMTFIPLPEHEQRKSKAIVDGIASRFGKSLGSIFYIMLLLIFGDIASTIPYVSLLIVCIVLLWVFAIKKLSKMVAHKIDVEVSHQDDSRVVEVSEEDILKPKPA